MSMHRNRLSVYVTGVALVCVSSCYAITVRIPFPCILGFEDMVFSKLGGRVLLRNTVHCQHREHAIVMIFCTQPFTALLQVSQNTHESVRKGYPIHVHLYLN